MPEASVRKMPKRSPEENPVVELAKIGQRGSSFRSNGCNLQFQKWNQSSQDRCRSGDQADTDWVSTRAPHVQGDGFILKCRKSENLEALQLIGVKGRKRDTLLDTKMNKRNWPGF
ncbi:Zinc finger protein 341 [Manis javanica]|nr:Zinc finger protein 341 [Manis javanica]